MCVFKLPREKKKKKRGGREVTTKSQMWVQNENNLHKPKENVHGANCNKSDAQTKSQIKS